jgi:hypothetical protein
MMRSARLLCIVLIGLCAVTATSAQNPGTGLYSFSSFDSRGFDSINIGNLNTHFEIPIVSKQGRGINFSYSLVYDGLVWSPTVANGGTYWTPDSGWGFHGQLGSGIIGYLASTDSGAATAGSITDSNGNKIANNGDGTFNDTLGGTELTIAPTNQAVSVSVLPLTFYTYSLSLV